jgi:hypothetical protein
LTTLSQLPWDQPEFERRLIEWIITCDQPFDEVQKPEFIAIMEYGRDPKTFSLPKRDGVRRRIMVLGKETIQKTKDMFAVCILPYCLLYHRSHFFLGPGFGQ